MDGEAGAYGIQGKASAFVERIVGDKDTVIGLPVMHVKEFLNNIKDKSWGENMKFSDLYLHESRENSAFSYW